MEVSVAISKHVRFDLFLKNNSASNLPGTVSNKMLISLCYGVVAKTSPSSCFLSPNSFFFIKC